MAKFKKRPVEIEAMKYLVSEVCILKLAEFMGGMAKTQPIDGVTKLVIETLEGPIFASPGDWIVKGIKGEFYPCKPDIFEMTYEPAEK